MRLFYITIIASLIGLLPRHVYSQYELRNVDELNELKSLPQEKVYLSHTGPMIFSGEYLYYSFDCLNRQTHGYSDISKIGYVALVNEQKEVILEQKLRLTNGRSQGDFFVNTDLPSGNYKLLGYTHWMKNGGSAMVFQDDLVIINPYKNDQSSLLGGENNSPLNTNTKVSTKDNRPLMALELDQDSYGQREKARLTLKNFKENLSYGVYTIQVKKEDFAKNLEAENAVDFSDKALKNSFDWQIRLGDVVYLPEQAGELLSGTFKTSTGMSPGKLPLVISYPGREFRIEKEFTDNDGNFFAYLDNRYVTPRAVIQVENAKEEYNVVMNPKGKLDLSGLRFNSYNLRPDSRDEIIQRSVHNQIANQFFAVRPDSLKLSLERNPYNWAQPETFYLDDYTRFPTLEDTVVELWEDVSYRDGGKEPDFIRMALKEGLFDGYYEAKPAALVIDGVYIPNHEEYRKFNARRIQSITLVRDFYRIGATLYHGMISLATVDGKFYQDYQSKYGANIVLDEPLAKKDYFKQSYQEGDASNDRIPDYRYILLWQPHFELKSNSPYFTFYTSDVSGNFKVILNGFTSYGKPIHLEKSFLVEDADGSD